MRPSTSAFWLLATLYWALAACSSATSGECRIAADCASGVCGEDGQCNTTGLADGGTDAAQGTADAATSACGSAADGIITRDELPMAAGSSASFRVATNATFSTAGESVDGTLTWDMDRPLANDVDTEVVLSGLSGTWYENAFPGASYTGKLSQDSDLLGVFQLVNDGLYLLGVVSPEGGLTRTELSYDPAVLLMPLPLREGDTWTTDSDVSGVATGIVSFHSESYVGLADASGELVTPFGTFRTLRTRIDLTRTVGLLVTTTRQYSFLSECAGIVASIVSENNEEDVDFCAAAELRRVIP
ncbi:MAG: hypothetical protein GY811_24895 [Myxococcales bacterium]|nr:hypothetical protein [Myxococcales bacterium]